MIIDDLNAEDLIAYLYLLFERNSVITSEEEYHSRRQVRVSFYEHMLNREYTWMPDLSDNNVGADGSSATYGGDLIDPPEDDAPSPSKSRGNPSPQSVRKQLVSKTYTPPTTFDPDASKPFGNILDAPLN